MDEPIHVSVLTGFLGAGKTTLLNRALQDPRFEDTAIIINEFGDVALDHLLVEAPREDIIELSSGCLCCQMRGEFIDLLDRIVELHRCGMKSVRRILVETSGMADPIPVIQAILAYSTRQQSLALAKVVCLIDGIQGETALTQHEEAVRQIIVADELLITKTQSANPPPKDILFQIARKINRTANLSYLNEDTDLFQLVGGDFALSKTNGAGVREWLGSVEDELSHAGTHVARESRFDSFSIVSDCAMDAMALQSFLDLLASSQGPELLRAKGLVKSREHPECPYLVHCVQRLVSPIVELDEWPDADHRTRLVFISNGIDPKYIRKLFDGFSNSLAPDTPDRSTLVDNPLAISGFRL